MGPKPHEDIELKLRPPEEVMRLARLGSFHQCRLSFMRTLLRRIRREQWEYKRPKFEIDQKGIGVAVYEMHGPERVYSLVCFAHDLPAGQRSDRVIAHAWDATFCLYDGIPTDSDLDRLAQNVPKQEAGRISSKEISLSRANRSVRMFEYVIDCLSAGRQPDIARIEEVGYLMRTTAVYGSGKFGAADREEIAGRPEFAGPFQAEMLSVYLTRCFTVDIAEHLAKCRAPESAVRLDPELRRRLGVGNSTGLGLAPFLINHPVLFNNWITARETALARVRARPSASQDEVAEFHRLISRAKMNTAIWRSEHPVQIVKLAQLLADLEFLQNHLSVNVFQEDRPWNALYLWGRAHLSAEGVEQLVSLLLEPFGDLVDDLADTMGADENAAFLINGAMSLDELRSIATEVYGWVREIDWDLPNNVARVWYVSEEKLEPRLGERFDEPIEPFEQPLAPGRDAAAMCRDIDKWEGGLSVADFLLRHPEHRHVVRRAQITQRYPYAEIRDNTISSELLPIDLLRCKLSFFGATHFDPRSDRWVRINMFKNAPFPDEIFTLKDDDWSYPQSDGIGS